MAELDGGESGERKVVSLKLSLDDQNPNRKIRFLTFSYVPHRLLWVFSLQMVKKDESIYLAPSLGQEVEVVASTVEGTTFRGRAKGLSLSLHASGVVNLHIGSESRRLQAEGEEKPQYGRLVTLSVNNLGILREATDENDELQGGSAEPLPIGHLPGLGPLTVTVFRLESGVEWEPPLISQAVQGKYRISLTGKSVDYGFVVGQVGGEGSVKGDVAIHLHR